ncbi:MAG: AtpZ/AtpI family protein [Candidatus Saccharimonadales bacterium]
MSGKPSGKKVKSPRVETSADRLARIADAKQQFLDSALNMSWQLAVTIIVPVIIGVQLDNHFKSAPAWTLGALFLAVFMACGVVVKTLHGVKTAQSDNDKRSKS